MDSETWGKLEKTCAAADWHLKQIGAVLPILEEIRNFLYELKNREHLEYKKELLRLEEQLKMIVSNPDPEKRVFTYLKEKLECDWPVAIPENEICKTKKEKEIRANNILDSLIQGSLENKKFLDFGCGEGFVSFQALQQNPTLSVGYDKMEYLWDFPKKDNLIFVNNLETLQKFAPFDVVLAYDVIDHCSSPLEMLKQIKNLVSDTGILYLRCHPWCSRHGCHQYHDLNKAFIHLIFSEYELEKMGVQHHSPIKITDPEKEYDDLIREAGFFHISKSISRTEMEPFFQENIIIKDQMKLNLEKMNKQYIPYKCTVDFVDYMLTKRNTAL